MFPSPVCPEDGILYETHLLQRLVLLVLAISNRPQYAPAVGQQITNTILHLDEFGHGNITLLGADQGTFNSMLMPDPSGGLANWNVLVYTLPFTWDCW